MNESCKTCGKRTWMLIENECWSCRRNPMSKPQITPFKELEFREHVPGAYFAIGPFGVEYRVWCRGVTWACRAVDRDWVAQNFTTYSAAVQAANEHCWKELRRWVR